VSGSSWGEFEGAEFQFDRPLFLSPCSNFKLEVREMGRWVSLFAAWIEIRLSWDDSRAMRNDDACWCGEEEKVEVTPRSVRPGKV
jgi:hypothetical protein